MARRPRHAQVVGVARHRTRPDTGSDPRDRLGGTGPDDLVDSRVCPEFCRWIRQCRLQILPSRDRHRTQPDRARRSPRAPHTAPARSPKLDWSFYALVVYMVVILLCPSAWRWPRRPRARARIVSLYIATVSGEVGFRRGASGTDQPAPLQTPALSWRRCSARCVELATGKPARIGLQPYPGRSNGWRCRRRQPRLARLRRPLLSPHCDPWFIAWGAPGLRLALGGVYPRPTTLALRFAECRLGGRHRTASRATASAPGGPVACAAGLCGGHRRDCGDDQPCVRRRLPRGSRSLSAMVAHA